MKVNAKTGFKPGVQTDAKAAAKAAGKTAVKAGGTVAMEKQQISPTSWWAVIDDPDGNAIGLYEGTT